MASKRGLQVGMLGLLMVSLLLGLAVYTVEPATAAPPQGPDYPCPWCEYDGFRHDCYDYHCSYPNRHGVYFKWWCCDCDDDCHYEWTFEYCDDIC